MSRPKPFPFIVTEDGMTIHSEDYQPIVLKIRERGNTYTSYYYLYRYLTRTEQKTLSRVKTEQGILRLVDDIRIINDPEVYSYEVIS